jgi:hypothetical protein
MESAWAGPVDVADGVVIALAEAFTVFPSVGRRNEAGMAIFVAIQRVGRTMIVEVLAGSGNAILIAAGARSGKLRRSVLPAAGSLLRAVARSLLRWRALALGGDGRSCGS